MQIESIRFGRLDVEEKDIFYFEHGVLGFSEKQHFAFLPYEEGSPFSFLQSTNDPELSFMVVDAFRFFDDYQFELDDGVAEMLAISLDNPPQILNIVRVPEKVEEMTANLLAPLVINRQTGNARQVVLEGTKYLLRQRLFPNGFSKASSGGEEK